MVASYMAILKFVDESRTILKCSYPPEPVLTEAASHSCVMKMII